MATPAFSLYYLILSIHMQVNESLFKEICNFIYSRLQVTCCGPCGRIVRIGVEQSEQILRAMILQYVPKKTSHQRKTTLIFLRESISVCARKIQC